MADIKEIMEQTGKAAGKVVKSPLFLGVCGVGIIALLWDSGNKGSSGETVTFSEATDYSGYPDVSGDVSTLANNMSAAMQEMYDAMNESNAAMQQQMQDSYLQMQEQTADQFEKMNTVIDNKISNMEFVQKESIAAVQDYNYGLMESVSSLTAQLDQARTDAAAAKAEADAAKQTAADALKKASETTTKTTQKTSSTTAAKTTTTTSAPKTTTTQKTTTSSTKAVNTSIVNAVIRGDYGNGQARVNALTKAGYDAKAVQAAVNKKLLG